MQKKHDHRRTEKDRILRSKQRLLKQKRKGDGEGKGITGSGIVRVIKRCAKRRKDRQTTLRKLRSETVDVRKGGREGGHRSVGEPAVFGATCCEYTKIRNGASGSGDERLQDDMKVLQ